MAYCSCEQLVTGRDIPLHVVCSIRYDGVAEHCHSSGLFSEIGRKIVQKCRPSLQWRVVGNFLPPKVYGWWLRAVSD